MVREHAVRLQELAAGDVRAEGLKDLRRIEAAGAVPGIDRDPEVPQRPRVVVRVDPFTDHVPKVFRIVVHVGRVRHKAGFHGRFFRRVLGKVQDLGDIGTFDPALFRKELEPVAVERMMARGDLDRGIAVEVHGRHEHGGRRGQPALLDVHTGQRQALDERFGQTVCRDTGVVSDRDRIGGTVSRSDPVFEPAGKSITDIVRHFIGQLDLLSRDTVCRDAADIGPAFQDLVGLF